MASASKVANAPTCSVRPRSAKRPAPKNAARLPNIRAVVRHSSAVVPSMKASDRTLAAASPPRLSATAPIGG